jgi:N-methylhydantoinase A/oxoprolinase/acetone carboxylase beta subunit
MRYVGQGHEVEVEIPGGPLGTASLPVLTASFEAAYRTLYSRTPLGVPIEALNWRLVVSGPAPSIALGSPAAAEPGGALPIKRTRPAYFSEARGYLETPVYDRYGLSVGMSFEGPAIIEERESTTVLGPGTRIRVDGQLNVVAEPR